MALNLSESLIIVWGKHIDRVFSYTHLLSESAISTCAVEVPTLTAGSDVSRTTLKDSSGSTIPSIAILVFTHCLLI